MAYRTLIAWIALAHATATAMAQSATTPATLRQPRASWSSQDTSSSPRPTGSPRGDGTANVAASEATASPRASGRSRGDRRPRHNDLQCSGGPGADATGGDDGERPLAERLDRGFDRRRPRRPQVRPRHGQASRVSPKERASCPMTRVRSGGDYDITPYTLRVTGTNQPEQAIVDWILRETGYETWHSEPLGLLCATGERCTSTTRLRSRPSSRRSSTGSSTAKRNRRSSAFASSRSVAQTGVPRRFR